MLADYDFYKNIFRGIVFADANSYEYFGERASEELAPFSSLKVFEEGEASLQLKRCACRIADILYSSTSGSKNGKQVASESVAGYYSVSYVNNTDSQIKAQINNAIKLYISKYIFGAKKVVW